MRRLPKAFGLVVLAVLVLGASGCGWWKDVRDWWRPAEMARASPEALFRRGAELYQEGRYKRAIESFQRLKEIFPLHSLVVNAELGIADSYFSDQSYIEAEMAYRDFIAMRPTNENLPYVMFQLAMCHFNQIGAIDRDQTETVKALKEFERLIARFPNSKFSLLAERNALECRKKLAEKEFYVGHNYFLRDKYRAALGRFETIARDYPGLGLDYRVRQFIEESKRRLSLQEAKQQAARERQEKKIKESRATAKKAAAAAPVNPSADTSTKQQDVKSAQ